MAHLSPETRRDDSGSGGPSYWRFAAMIATSMAAMFVLMYANTFVFDHLKWSETRFYMTFVCATRRFATWRGGRTRLWAVAAAH